MWSIWKKALKFHILNSILKSKFKIEFAYFLVYAFGFSRLSTKYETTKPPAMRVVSKKCYTK